MNVSAMRGCCSTSGFQTVKYLQNRSYWLVFLPGVAPCGQSKGSGDLWHLLPPPGSHVHGHELHQQGPAAHDRLRSSVQQEQVGENRRDAYVYLGALRLLDTQEVATEVPFFFVWLFPLQFRGDSYQPSAHPHSSDAQPEH